MHFSLSQLFKAKVSTPVADGLTQPQREAIVDLLHIGMYTDNLIALAETKVINDTVGSFDWEAKTSFESYEARSIAKARDAKENEESKNALLDSVRDRLNTPKARALALKVCKQLFASDGTTEKEASLLARIKEILG